MWRGTVSGLSQSWWHIRARGSRCSPLATLAYKLRQPVTFRWLRIVGAAVIERDGALSTYSTRPFLGTTEMLRFVLRLARRLNGWALSIQLHVPVEITKFVVIGGVALLVTAGVFASQKVTTETEIGHSGIRVKGQPSQQEQEYGEVKPTPSDREPLLQQTETSGQKGRGYYLKRFRVIGDSDDSDPEGQFFYRRAECPAFSKNPRIEKVCSMPQNERHRYPVDVVMNQPKPKKRRPT
jgi:hypothetical protein